MEKLIHTHEVDGVESPAVVRMAYGVYEVRWGRLPHAFGGSPVHDLAVYIPKPLFVPAESIIAAIIDHLEQEQDEPLEMCIENVTAIEALSVALHMLRAKTARRAGK